MPKEGKCDQELREKTYYKSWHTKDPDTWVSKQRLWYNYVFMLKKIEENVGTMDFKIEDCNRRLDSIFQSQTFQHENIQYLKLRIHNSKLNTMEDRLET